jgi:UDP-glucose 4-epimerase
MNKWGKVLVTGGAGFIGSHLVDFLIDQGAEVTVLDDLSSGLLPNLDANLARKERPVRFVQGSITDPAALTNALSGVDTVFHLAAIASVQASVENPLATHEVGTTGTLLVLEACRKAGVRRLVFAGSSSAYGRPDTEIQTETTPLEPLSPYAASKLAGEMYCRAFAHSYPLETVILRFFNVFGPRQRPDSPYSGVIALFAKALTEGRVPTIFGDGKQTRDFVFVGDVVRCLGLAAQKPGVSGQVFHVGTGRGTDLWQLISALNHTLGTDITPKLAPARAGDVRHSCASIEKTRKILDWAPLCSLEDGLAKTMAWMSGK